MIEFCYKRAATLPGKIINVIQSFSFQLYEIIIDYLFKVAKVASKQCWGVILTSLFFYIKLLKVIHSVERSLDISFNLFI